MKTLIITILLLTFTSGQEKSQTEIIQPIEISFNQQKVESLIKLLYYEWQYRMSIFIIGTGNVLLIHSYEKKGKQLGLVISLLGLTWNYYNQKMIEKHKKELTIKTSLSDN